MQGVSVWDRYHGERYFLHDMVRWTTVVVYRICGNNDINQYCDYLWNCQWSGTGMAGYVTYENDRDFAEHSQSAFGYFSAGDSVAIRVGDLVGASNIFNFVYNTLQLTTLDPANDVGLAQMVMGSQTHGVTPMALAAAFQIFYDGQYTTPHLYTRVLDRDGNIYLENNATSYQALTPQTAYIMNRLLKNVLYSNVGTASGRYPNSNGMESFGKTGTASDEKDLWFVGGTPYYVTAVWWGYDAPYDMTNTLGKNQAKTRTCVTAWKAYMEQVQANLPYKAFPTSDGVVERAYCTQSGLLAGANCPSRATGYYRADDLPDTCNYSHSSGVAAAQSADTAPVVGQDTTGLDTD